MRRDTLARFIQGAVVAVLPLAASGCGRQCSAPPGPPPPNQVFLVDGGIGDGGWSFCFEACSGENGSGGYVTSSCEPQTNSAGQPVIKCTLVPRTDYCTGRRPDGLVAGECTGGSALGRHFAVAAHLEAASVPAFRRLRAELRAHGAPRRLADACTRAARDEVRHARSAARLARRFGATRPPVRIRPPQTRSMMALAVENAREGCVGETFGALLATFGAATAEAADVRAHLSSIAADETRHAELAWAIDAWLRTRLSPRERAHLEAVRADALAELATSLSAPVDGELARAAGLPSPAIARQLHRAFAAEVARRA